MASRRALVYGGKGALGSAIVKLFRQNNWVSPTAIAISYQLTICCKQWVGSIDLVQNEEADANVLITNSESLPAQEAEVVDSVGKLLSDDKKLDVIICVAGGWAGGNSASKGMYFLLLSLVLFLIVVMFRFHQEL